MEGDCRSVAKRNCSNAFLSAETKGARPNDIKH